MNFRKATIKDVDTLIKLRIDLLLILFGSLTKNDEDIIRMRLAGYFVKHIDFDFIAMLAEENNNIVSTVFLVTSELPAGPEFITGKKGTLVNVFTYPEYRRMGLATKLIKLIIEIAKQNGVSMIDLYASKDGKPLYERFGFTEPNLVAMQLEL